MNNGERCGVRTQAEMYHGMDIILTMQINDSTKVKQHKTIDQQQHSIVKPVCQASQSYKGFYQKIKTTGVH